MSMVIKLIFPIYFKKKLKMKSTIIKIKRMIDTNFGIFFTNLSVKGFTIYKKIRQAVPHTKLISKAIYLPKLNFKSV